jgi:hypothetical protein
VQKPGRPFGVSLAIFVSVCLFTILPLMQVGMILLVRQHFLNLNFEDSGLQTIAMGGDFLGVPEGSIIVQSVLSLAFLVVAALAWRGKPSSMRFIMVGAVILLTVIQLISVVASQLSAPNFQAGSSSLDGLMNSIGTGQFILQLLVLLYVAWYMNRGPARAFYRGYYLPNPAAEAEVAASEA